MINLTYSWNNFANAKIKKRCGLLIKWEFESKRERTKIRNLFKKEFIDYYKLNDKNIDILKVDNVNKE